MFDGFRPEPWFWWTIGLVIALPLLSIILGELSARLQYRGNPLYKPVNTVRHFVLPAGALVVLLSQVVGLPANGDPVKVLTTVFAFFALLATLSFFNTALFINADVRSWRAKVPRIFLDIARLLLIALGITILLWAVWGQSPGQFFAALGVTSIVLGLTLQNSIGGIVSGLLVLFEQPFTIGDQVEIGGTNGKVVEVNWRATHIDTGNSLVIVPNSSISSAQLTNFSRPKLTHDESVSLRFALTDPPNQVRAMLGEIALSLPQRDPETTPEVLLAGLDGGAATYQVTFTVERYEQVAAARDQLFTRVWYAAPRQGFQLLGLDRSAEQQPEALLTHLQTLAPVLQAGEAELRELIPAARLLRFAAGEVAQREGQLPAGVRFIVAGSARGEVIHPLQGPRPIVEYRTGDYFGEIALTGHRTLTRVVALEDLDVVEIATETLERLLERKPKLAQQIDEVMEQRRTKAAAATLNLRVVAPRGGEQRNAPLSA